LSDVLIVTGARGFLGQAIMAEAHRRRIAAEGVSRRRLPGTTQIADYAETPCPQGATLVHLADARDADEVAAHPELALQAIELAKALAAKPYAHIVYASSVAALPGAGGEPHGRTEYGEMKRDCEAIFARRGASIARLTNLYGPGGMAANSVIAEIIDRLNETGPIVVRNAAAARDFLHVSDAAAAMLALAERRPGGALTIASGRTVTIGEIAELVLSAAGQGGRDVISQADDPTDRIEVDIAETVERLGWRPAISFADGLAALCAARA
jgi:nucleoside-diphosphate-sugar epimerase